MVGRDFRFDTIMKQDKHTLAKRYFREMLDLIYVAFTRTKKKLFLCEQGWTFRQWLREQQRESTHRASMEEENEHKIVKTVSGVSDRLFFADHVSTSGMEP